MAEVLGNEAFQDGRFDEFMLSIALQQGGEFLSGQSRGIGLLTMIVSIRYPAPGTKGDIFGQYIRTGMFFFAVCWVQLESFLSLWIYEGSVFYVKRYPLSVLHPGDIF